MDGRAMDWGDNGEAAKNMPVEVKGSVASETIRNLVVRSNFAPIPYAASFLNAHASTSAEAVST